jgi:uncharacterized protein (TIGR02246 family)
LSESLPRRVRGLAILLTLACGVACSAETSPYDEAELETFVARYLAAWSSGDPAQVAAFFAEDGVMIINGTEPRIGRAAITVAARGFMAAYPDLVMTLDALESSGRDVALRWTFTGTNLGPAGTGNQVFVLGEERWTLAADGKLLRCAADFRRGRDPVPPEPAPR